mmetsp:Transcript_5804/g.11511  ORF Transcript_5804/g.11511 Transcript_5804/m.11511 type:complete len:384 (+) Transcript_5804:54-1205(+)|eukprot:CAMPEP_0167790762 /NCGR_PEP_ID=MMETSP0111_2-20121227/11527_1 /TAXON_ID=91324 /ORGANISM="Lotharella globosa, Strain CCCM811" /LENGTH=383 /DNA_ID=CAMNT_0007683289 /DNA_START=93 /DNA_END=1244 /DNA_ORIENTATION=+
MPVATATPNHAAPHAAAVDAVPASANHANVERKEETGSKVASSGCLYALGVALLLAACCAMSVGFSLYNKYLFSGPIKAPIFITATHRMFAFVGAFLAWQLSPASFYTRTKVDKPEMWQKIMLIPVGFVMNIGMNNLSLQFTTLALNQLIRSFSPVSIALTSFLIEGKTQSWAKSITLGALVGGVVMGVFSSPDFEMLGFLICAGSVLGQSLSIVMTALVMGGTSVKLHVFDVLLYTSLPTLLILLPWSYALGEFEVLENAFIEHGFETTMGLIIAGGTLAFTYNLASICFIRLTSSVYFGVTGGFRCALAIAASFYFFPQKIGFLSIAGTVIAISAFIVNSFFTMKEKLESMDASKKITSIKQVEKQIEDEEEGRSLLKGRN